jgi:serine/threonine-protein kinase RsbW
VDLALELDVPPRPEFIAIVRLVVSSLAAGRRALADDRIDDLKLAVSEACTNAMDAHLSAGVDEPVLVKVYEGEERIEITIEDVGRGFDPGLLPQHPPVTDPERLNFERGLGIPLMRTLVDGVEFVRTERGTCVRMTLFGAAVDADSTREIAGLPGLLQQLKEARRTGQRPG